MERWVLVLLLVTPWTGISQAYDCGDSSLTVLAGHPITVASPRFPQRYPRNAHCWWTIQVNDNEDFIQLEFEVGKLEYESHCQYDYVEVVYYENQNEIVMGRLCGNQCGGTRVVVPNNEVLVHFVSDRNIQKKGFRADVSAVPPTTTSGVFCDCNIGCLYFDDTSGGGDTGGGDTGGDTGGGDTGGDAGGGDTGGDTGGGDTGGGDTGGDTGGGDTGGGDTGGGDTGGGDTGGGDTGGGATGGGDTSGGDTGGGDNAGCGRNQLNGIEKIVGGSAADKHEYPWQIMLLKVVNNQLFIICGGTIIGPQWVLTAAHCFEQTGQYRVATGMHNWNATESSRDDVNVFTIHKHDHYDNVTLENDIAILKLEQSVIYDDFVQPACLSRQPARVGDNVTCVITGWGTLVSGGSLSDILQEAEVKIMAAADTCFSLTYYYQNECSYGYAGSLLNNTIMMLAGNPVGGVDTCQGDSGGPLVCANTDGAFVLQGVTSFGIGCGDPGYPGVYTVVASYANWIQSTTGITIT